MVGKICEKVVLSGEWNSVCGESEEDLLQDTQILGPRGPTHHLLRLSPRCH